jgi:hypothetical protein
VSRDFRNSYHSLSGSGAVESNKCISTFRRNMLPLSSGGLNFLYVGVEGSRIENVDCMRRTRFLSHHSRIHLDGILSS